MTKLQKPFEDEFGIYIHWPFCASKCPYCDFNSHVRRNGIDEARYLAAFSRELAWFGERTPGRRVTSIFFGGGTPSLMAPGTVGGILDAIAANWSVADNAEITLEANPSSVEAGRFAGYRAAGVNRASLGVQSFDDGDLRRLGRLHTGEEARAAIAIARRTFERFSFDLIYARPGQSAAAWRDELGKALALGAGHLSLYQLTIEPGTPFHALHRAGKLTTPTGDVARALFDLTQEMTAAGGLSAYEISNHARPGEECRHNLVYWRYHDYVGAGPGAHGRITVAGEKYATETSRQPEAWLARVEAAGNGVSDESLVSSAEQADEMLLMGLRLAEGLELNRLAEETGLEIAPEAIEALASADWIAVCACEGEAQARRLEVRDAGRAVLDELVLRLSQALRPVKPGSNNYRA